MSTDVNVSALIHAKLRRPRVQGAVITRPRLLTQLAALRPLTLVVAPAGYGKTTLLSAWLETIQIPSAWLTLDETDSDPQNFLRCFLAAMQTIFPNSGRETRSLLDGAVLPSPVLLARNLANDLDVAPGPFILVLDDYHCVHGTAVHSLIDGLLRRPPRSLSLIIATRRDPPLAQPALRMYNQLTELGTKDLRFTPTETLSYLRQTLSSLNAGEKIAEELATQTEGWIAGIHMATIHARSQPDCIKTLAQIGSRYSADFFAAEVLSQQSPLLQEFLTKTSIVDQMCGSLCNALTGGAEGQAHLEWLNKNNLFVFALDDDRRWFRYHHLLRRLLQLRLQRALTTEEIAALHLRASNWFAQHGLMESALSHALAAGDVNAAVQLAACNRHAWMNQEQWPMMRRCLQYFDRQTVERHPDLLLMQAWLLVARGETQAVALLLEQIDAVFADQVDAAESLPSTDSIRLLQYEADILRCVLLYFSAQPRRVIELAQAALEKIPGNWRLARSYARQTLAGALQMEGDLPGAYRALGELVSRPASPQHAHHVRTLAGLGAIQWIAGDLHGLQRTADRVLQMSSALQLDESTGWARYAAASVHYHWGELDSAAAILAPMMEQPHAFNVQVFANASYVLALIHQAQGRDAQASAVMNTAIETARHGHDGCLTMLRAFQAELALRQGDLNAALQWGIQNHGELTPVIDFAAPQLVRPKILLAQGTLPARREAAVLLSHAHEFFAAIHSTRFLIEVLALQALCRHADGNAKGALEILKQALTLAEPGGFIRLFADLGRALEPLLTILTWRGGMSGYIAKIQAAISPVNEQPTPQDKLSPLSSTTHVTPDHRTPPRSHPDLLEPLTSRELDVLTGLTRRLTNKEIAHELGISEYTVKQYTTNLYAKLNVEGRREIAARARTLGILTGD